MRWLRRFVLTVATGVLCWALAVATGAIIPTNVVAKSSNQGSLVKVGLVQGPIHTDFLLPLDGNTRRDFAILDLPDDASWLLVGWGAREFYTTVGDYSDVSISALSRAIIGDEAVMRYELVASYSPVLSIDLTPSEYERLRHSILSETDFTQPVGAGFLQAGDRYFAAIGKFNLVNTCNQWIAHSLQQAGRRFGSWTQTTWAVRLSLAIYG